MGKKMMISLKSTDEVKQFVNDIMRLEGEFDLISGKYIVDAKSILGIYSLNLSRPLELVVCGECEKGLEVLEKYVVPYK